MKKIFKLTSGMNEKRLDELVEDSEFLDEYFTTLLMKLQDVKDDNTRNRRIIIAYETLVMEFGYGLFLETKMRLTEMARNSEIYKKKMEDVKYLEKNLED